MEPSDVEAVLRFLRANGFTQAESALREDVSERSEMGSFDFEKFLFPIPPPLKTQAILRSPESGARGASGLSVDGSTSDDEFVSMNSSTSEFVNPYGRRSSSQVDSDASSDGLTQFETARAYSEQIEFYWHDDREEDHFMSPVFQAAADFFNCPTEDKFIMTSDTANNLCESTTGLYDKSEGSQTEEGGINYLEKPCLISLEHESYDNEVDVREYRHLDDKWNQSRTDHDEPNLFGKCHLGSDYPLQYAPGSLKEMGVNDHELNDELIAEKGLLPAQYYAFEDGNEGLDDPVSDAVEEEEEANVIDEPLLAGNGSRDDQYELFDLQIIHRKNRTGFEESKDLPIVPKAVIAGRYYVTKYLGSAAFSKVVQAQDLRTGVDVCLKIIKNDKDFFDQSLDEIKLLKLVNRHDPADEHHILRLYDYFYYQEHLFIVCELLRANLYEFQKFNERSNGEPYFTPSRLQMVTIQCLEALVFLHGLGIIHCDLKPENILIKNYKRCEIKVIDLGSSCFRTDNLCLYVQSRSYRAPEVILGLPYDEKIDLWSLGCILAELSSGEVLFPNEAVVMILACIIGKLGPIDLDMLEKGQETYKYFTKEYDLYFMDEETGEMEYLIPEESSLEDNLGDSDVLFVDFVRTLLEINPERRPTAREALEHPWLSYPY